jgi:hypothetical protein
MAENASDHLSYYLKIDKVHLDDLASIRHWPQLKVAFDGAELWVTGFDEILIASKEIKIIPFKELYYSKSGRLFPLNSHLPCGTLKGLLWTPIERALPLAKPAYNNNYFGTSEMVSVKLAAIEQETTASIMVANINSFGRYVENSPAVRLKSISWCILDDDKVMIMGEPLLPIDGKVYWMRQHFIFPAGYDLEFPLLQTQINHLVNPENEYWIIWHEEGTYAQVERHFLERLSIGSFRSTLQNIRKQ